jgi:Uma2 family endonuclease
MNLAEAPLLTAEEFLDLPDLGYPSELVKGRIVKMNVPGVRHGRVCLRIGQILQNFLDEHDLGRAVCNDSGVVTERGPDTVRGADVSYYSYASIPKDQPLPVGYAHDPADLVFEVLSPRNTWPTVLVKVGEYLNAGVSVVCVADPEHEVVIKHLPDRPPERLSGSDVLTLPELLPGFTVPVARFFA